MRSLPLVLGVLILSSCAGPAPDPYGPTSERTGGANQIIVTTDATPDEAYGNVVRLLAERGYSLAASNETARVVTTEPKQFMGQHAMRVTATVTEAPEGARITMRGNFKSGLNVGQFMLGSAAAEDPEAAVEDRGQGGSPMRGAFDVLDELARALGGDVKYARVAS